MPPSILNGFGTNFFRFEVASTFFGNLLPTCNMDRKALVTNGLSHTSKIDFVRLERSKFKDLLPEQCQCIDFKADFFARVFVRHDQHAVVRRGLV